MAVYMIRAGENGPVKIGCSDDVTNRLVKMQADNHERLAILRIFGGGEAEEAALHLRFADQRLHGEWFAFSRLMLGHLGLHELTAPEPDPPQLPEPLDPVHGHEPLGPVLRSFRISRGLTQAEVAKAIGVARPTLAGIELGHDEPGRRTLIAAAKFFGVPLDAFCKAEAA